MNLSAEQWRGIPVAIARTVARKTGHGVVANGIVPDLLRVPFEAAVAAELKAHGVDVRDMVWIHLSAGGDGAVELDEVNRARDSLLPSVPLVVLTASDAPTLATLRRAAPDIISFASYAFEIQPRLPPLRQLLKNLRRFAREDGAFADLPRLPPDPKGCGRLSVERLYIDLVDLRENWILQSDGTLQSGLPTGPRVLLRALLGHPGAGKTMFLRHIAGVYARGLADPFGVGRRVPIYAHLPDIISAREFAPAGAGFLFVLGRHLEHAGVDGARLIEACPGKLILLLDAFDELPSASSRRWIIDQLNGGQVAGVLASRYHAISDLPAGLLVNVCAPLERSQASAVLSKFFEARGAESHGGRSAHQLLSRPELQALSTSPLLVVLLGLVFELDGHLPDRRLGLYQRLTGILLERWLRTRYWAEAHVSRDHVKRIAGAIAWRMLDSGRATVTSDELREVLLSQEPVPGGDPESSGRKVSAILAAFRAGDALITARPGGEWGFVHSTFAEYFAALELASGGTRWEQVLANPFRPELTGVIGFSVGELGERAEEGRLSELAVALCGRAPPGVATSAEASAIAAVLPEDPGFISEDGQRLAIRLADLAFDMTYGAGHREVVADALLEVTRQSQGRTWRRALHLRVESWLNNLLAAPPPNLDPLFRRLPYVVNKLQSGEDDVPGDHEPISRVEIFGEYPSSMASERDFLASLPKHLSAVRRVRHALEAPLALSLAYGDLIVAWGLAKLGDRARSADLHARAARRIPHLDSVHQLCVSAFTERIVGAVQSRQNRPLSAGTGEKLETLSRFDRYKVDRLRFACRVLEPVESGNAWLVFVSGSSNSRAVSNSIAMGLLRGVRDVGQLYARVRALLQGVTALSPEVAAGWIEAALLFVPILPSEHVDQLLIEMVDWGEALPPKVVGELAAKLAIVAGGCGADDTWSRCSRFLTHSFSVLGPAHSAVEAHLPAVTLVLARRNRGTGLVPLASALGGVRAREQLTIGGALSLTCLLSAAGGADAQPVLALARDRLDADIPLPERLNISRGLMSASAFAPNGGALDASEWLVPRFKHVSDSFGTNSHFSLAVVEYFDIIVGGIALEFDYHAAS